MATNTACDLATKSCIACTKTTPPLTDERVAELHRQVPNWRLLSSWVKDDDTNKHSKTKVWIERIFQFRNFTEAMAFLNCVAGIAEQEGHHPDFTLRNYKFVSVRLTTHAIQTLSENDFIVAAKIDVVAHAPTA